MSSNASLNIGSVLSSRINSGISGALVDSKTSQDLLISNARAGWQQRYGAMQLENMIPNAYALFGGWSQSSKTVGP